MPHFFVKSSDITDNQVVISDKENYNHIARSLRARVGESLLLIDENQVQYETVIKTISKDRIISDIQKSYKSKRKLDFELYLAQSPLRSDAQSIIMEKACELGISGVYPVLTDNCAVAKSVVEKKIPKWRKIMFEASKQCERADIPECYSNTDIENLIISGKFTHIIAFCERIAVKTLKDYVLENPQVFNGSKVLVIIGPEGGFSDREFEIFKNLNIPMLTLGDLILKAETATIVALGNIIYEYINSR
ncbi:MAG: 16S rRNA (uracil(1498)-N(3))-methyltransferase [Alphaproteobacteria bacterium]|nr:16S rRNA (uracil(1498)-N(3))-methyltransferase [Alphaproteobacteria bacterium]